MAVAVTLLHPVLPDLMDEVLRLKGWSWSELEKGIELQDQKVDVTSLGWWFLQVDPVLWGETNLVNKPDDGGGLWTFFAYQRRSLRHRANTVHQCAAEVGKTREIVCLSLWMAITGRGSCLIGSALDGDLDELWEETQFQLRANPYLSQEVTHQTTKPYRRITFSNGLRLLYRPAGYDGRAWRGIHVRGAAFCDEAAKILNPRAWHEFWRSGKPSCEYRLYSVPTGDRLCDFQRIADKAPEAPEAEQSTAEVVASLLAQRKPSKTFTRYWWPKWIMPAPYWDEARRAEKIEQYGATDDPGYVHNVAGLPGDPEYSVFPARLLAPAVQYNPSYRSIRFVWDSIAERLDTEVLSVGSPQDLEEGIDPLEDAEEGVPAHPELVRIGQESHDVSGWQSKPESERTEVIRRAVRGVTQPCSGLTLGVDPGSASSPCEILGFSPHRALVLRLSLRGLDWIALRDVVAELDALIANARWGLDATGVGRPLLHHIQPVLFDRVAGFVFNMSVPDLDLVLGEPLADPGTGRALSLSYKELGTQLAERMLTDRRIILPRDPELIHLLQNHTYSQRGDLRVYSKVNDHVADAFRCYALASHFVEVGLLSSVPVTYAVPAGSQLAEPFSALKGF